MKHIDQIYECLKINYAAELYYVCELGKYLYYYYNESLSLEGIEFSEDLPKSTIWDYYRLAVHEGWIVNNPWVDETLEVTIQDPLEADLTKVTNVLFTEDIVEFNQEDFEKRQQDNLYNYCTPLLKQISFETKSDDKWVWSVKGKNDEYFRINNDALNKDLARQLWLSLIAYVAIHKLYNCGKPNNLWLRMTNQTTYNITALSYIIILTENTSCFLNSDNTDYWVNLDAHELSVQELNQFGYVAWYMIGLDKGYLNHWYDKKAKMNRMKELDIQEGDFVMLYERTKSQKLNYIKSIASCTLANICKIEKDKIHFDLIHTMKPRMSAEIEFENNDAEIKNMYNGKLPYQKLNVNRKCIDITDCGVEYCMLSELYFIVPLSECYDEVKIQLRDSDGNIRSIHIPQNDLIYWICKDYDYAEMNPSYDEKRFIDKYFKPTQEIPIYERYYSGDLSIYDEYGCDLIDYDIELQNM